ncbi:hypothetical protein [Lentibacillus cibarius]|nr:hypothetical protein [Lentibacillus cibarius]
MAEKKPGLKKLFSKSSNKDCCSVEIDEVTSNEDDCCDTEKTSKTQQEEA